MTQFPASFKSAFFFSFFFGFFLVFFSKYFVSINFKSRIMLNFKVRTYNPEKETPENSIFILSRGRNAGKPMFEPCPNCFILYCRNETEKENLYWIFYTLWKNRFFHPYLCGSVIDMLRLSELKKVIQNWIIPSFSKMEQNGKILQDIKSVYQLEQHYSKQLKQLSELRSILVQKYYYKI